METPSLLVLLRYAAYLLGAVSAALLLFQKLLITRFGLRRWQAYLLVLGGLALILWNAADRVIARHSPRLTVIGTVSDLGEDVYPKQHYYYMTFHVDYDGRHSRRFDSSPFLEPFAPSPIANGDIVKVSYLDWEPHSILRVECVSGRTPGWAKDSPDRTGEDWIWEVLGVTLLLSGLVISAFNRKNPASETAV